MKKASILDVVAKSGVSLATVSKVLNNSPTVRESNRQKVLQAIKELDYRPNSAARSLARGSTGVIGLTLVTLQDTVFDGIVQAVNEYLEDNGYFLALSIYNPEKHDTEHVLFQEDRVDGIIVLSPLNEERYVSELERKGIPFVIIDNHDERTRAITINVDNDKGGYDATRHLLELGHTKIAHLSGPGHFMSVRQRRQGFERALGEAGLRPLCVTHTRFGIRSGFNVGMEWLQSGGEMPTAVFAGDDALALGFMEALKSQGYRIPQEISVIGYDDQVFAQEIHPRLTTIRQPMEQMGLQAARRLLKLIGGAKRNSSILLQPELIARESTARVPSGRSQPS
ncbi:LacI family transcriptional regulator [Cohnella sp. CIP 111063]|uniref:LacI family DNA-binding transcriptional regulator n=1 Tax=unclassified Cohnella TaxID=2636738 RepID=UPI000B8BE3DA|nr:MULTISPECIES: LacI family DNA-binding transcriptional regulator [unclassified Cohnella]OXS54757.1 LacI family transcriptional regulator [Cohnella sp. CIP 111063]PRX64594.1 LacI family transcriptional regulator [Cohnella sp. SGD-V74]